MNTMQLTPEQQAVLQRQIKETKRFVSKRADSRPFGKIMAALWLKDQTLMMLGGEKFEIELKAVYDREVNPSKSTIEPKRKEETPTATTPAQIPMGFSASNESLCR